MIQDKRVTPRTGINFLLDKRLTVWMIFRGKVYTAKALPRERLARRVKWTVPG